MQLKYQNNLTPGRVPGSLISKDYPDHIISMEDKMKFKYPIPPIAGSKFSLFTTDITGPVELYIYINDVFLASHPCPNPPCHEAFFIPAGTDGQILRIVGMDEAGTKTEHFIQIQSATLPPFLTPENSEKTGDKRISTTSKTDGGQEPSTTAPK
jgi:hypothetical protein